MRARIVAAMSLNVFALDGAGQRPRIGDERRYEFQRRPGEAFAIVVGGGVADVAVLQPAFAGLSGDQAMFCCMAKPTAGGQPVGLTVALQYFMVQRLLQSSRLRATLFGQPHA